MNPQRWINRLQQLGLNVYEARVYLALLGETDAPVARIARKSGVPQAKIYAVLESLTARGFAQQILGEVKRFAGVPPREALAAYKRRVQQELDDVGATMDALARAAPQAPGEDPSSLGLRVVRGGNVGRVFEENVEAARQSVLVCIPSPLLVPPDRAEEQRLRKRRVEAKYLFEQAIVDHPEHGPLVRAAAAEFKNKRALADVPLRYAVFDSKLVMVALSEADGSTMGLIIPNAGFAQGMERLFRELWDKAKPM